MAPWRRVEAVLPQLRLYRSDPSKYPLSAQESMGFAVLNNPSKGICAACHLGAIGDDGNSRRFTDFKNRRMAIDISGNAWPLP
jgi:cytochrome c peroxidase